MAISGMASGVSGLLAHYWKFESSNPEACDTIYDEINSTDVIIFQNDTADSGHFSGISGIADQNIVISTVSGGKTGAKAYGMMHTLGDVEQWHNDSDFWKIPSGVSGTFTVAGWFKVPASMSGAGAVNILKISDVDTAATAVTANRTTFLLEGANSSTLRFSTYENTAKDTITIGSTLTYDEWVHIACVVDAVNSSGFLYKDGVIVQSGFNAAFDNHNYPGFPTFTNADPVGLLVDELYENGGAVCELGIWSGALTPAQVSGLYNSGSGVTVGAKTQVPGSGAYDSAIHNWKFSENTITSGTTLADSINSTNLEHIFGGSASGYFETTANDSIHTRSLSGVRDASNSSNGQSFEYEVYTTANSGTGQGLNGTPYQDGDFSISLWYRPSSDRESVSSSYDWFSIKESGAASINDTVLYMRMFAENAADPSKNKMQTNYRWLESSATSISSAEDCLTSSGLTNLQDTWVNHIISFNRARGCIRTWTNGSGYSATYITNETANIGRGWNKFFNTSTGSGYRDTNILFSLGTSTNARDRGSNPLLAGSGAVGDLVIFNSGLSDVHADYIWNNGSGNFFAPGATGTTSGFLGSYMLGVGIAVGTESGSVGSYLLAIESTNQTGAFAVTRPAITAWDWDLTKNDPSGYKHIESPSSPYFPEAKQNLIGGFDAQGESGVALDFGRFAVEPTGDQTSSVKAITLQMADASGIYFDNASGVRRGLGITNAKLWLADETDITTSGVDINLWYQTSGTWLKNHTMTSGSVGVLPFPTSEATAINLGNVSSSIANSSSSDYVYLIATLPSGTYSKGQLGGLGNNWNLRVSYTFNA